MTMVHPGNRPCASHKRSYARNFCVTSDSLGMSPEKQKMLRGEMYDPMDPELCADRTRVRNLCLVLNQTREEQVDERRRLLDEIFGRATDVWLQPPFFCDYGTNITLGEGVFFNFNCVV